MMLNCEDQSTRANKSTPHDVSDLKVQTVIQEERQIFHKAIKILDRPHAIHKDVRCTRLQVDSGIKRMKN